VAMNIIREIWDEGARNIAESANDIEKSIDKISGDDKEAAKRAGSIEKIIAALKEESETLGFTKEQMQQYRLSLLGADEATLQLAKDLSGSVQAFKDQQEALKEIEKANEKARQVQQSYLDDIEQRGIALHEELRTSLEVYNDSLKENDELLQAGAISAIDWARANDQAKEAMEEANKETEKGSDAARELSLTFQSAFEDAVIVSGTVKL